MRFIKGFFSFTFKSIIVFSLLIATAITAGAYVFIANAKDAEVPERVFASDSPSAVTVVDAKGTQLAKIQPDGGIIRVVPADRISPNMMNAMVSAEDGTFWDNPGFAPQRIAAAAIGHFRGQEGAGGGSTITQQYVKNHLVGDDYSIKRKWEEILSATKLTATRKKEDILTDYLNSVYFGRKATGIENAARAYFGVSAEELTVSQAALIAGVVQSPSGWDPAINKKKAEERYHYVISQMVRYGYITQEQADKEKFPDTIPPAPIEKTVGMDDGSTGLIATMAINELEAKGIKKELLFDRGATITTTIDPSIHASIQEKAKAAAKDNGVKVGVASVDPSTGDIKGFYGGDDGYGFNYATNPQMTGSTFKLFTLAAAVANNIDTSTIVSSAPYTTANGTTINNSDGMTCGECSIAEATKQSLNTSFHRIQDMLPEGAKTTRKMAKEMGVKAPLSEQDGSVMDSIVLGTYGTSPVDMAAGYASVSSGGVYREQHIVSKVESRFKHELYKTEVKDKRVLTTPQANAIDNTLAPIAAYSNNNGLAHEQGYMKTGTVQKGDGSATGANRDAWAVGYTKGDGSLSTAVWVGSDDGRALVDSYGNAIWGANLPTSLWKNIMDANG